MSVIEEAKDLLLGPGSFKIYYLQKEPLAEPYLGIIQMILMNAENKINAVNKFMKLNIIQKDVYIEKVERA